MTYSEPEYVTRQYHNTSNLNARIALHERFSTNSYGLQPWIFRHFDLPDEARILDVGCGPGRLWAENLSRLPQGWSITLTDASPGMVAKAKGSIRADAVMRGSGTEVFDRRVSDLVERLEEELASRGAILITKDTGLLVASK